MIRKPTAKELGAFIRMHRRARGMTQSELGAEVGLPGNEVCRYEKGRYIPSAAMWIAMTTVLDAPLFVQSDS